MSRIKRVGSCRVPSQTAPLSNCANSIARIGIVAAAVILVSTAQAQRSETNTTPRVYRDRVEPNWFADASGETNRFW